MYQRVGLAAGSALLPDGRKPDRRRRGRV